MRLKAYHSAPFLDFGDNLLLTLSLGFSAATKKPTANTSDTRIPMANLPKDLAGLKPQA
jgi:hypothetical protein